MSQLDMNWKEALRGAIRDPLLLLERVGLSPESVGFSESALASFSCCVPLGFLSKIQHGDPHDPLLWQVLPRYQETLDQPGFTTNPVGELEELALPGLIHKYHGRVLLTITGACAIHCRYCFRRHFPYAEQQPGSHLRDVRDYLTADPSISEVILSGGDPLTCSDHKLQTWIDTIDAIPHIQRLRIHSRIPSVLPERLTQALADQLHATRLQVVLVTHINHHREIDAFIADQLLPYQQAGVTLLNQSVLLKGVNDNVDELVKLQACLFQAGILPYYLHVLDPVAGASHFHIDKAQAQTLMRQLRSQLPGYLVPRLAQDVPGEDAKRILG